MQLPPPLKELLVQRVAERLVVVAQAEVERDKIQLGKVEQHDQPPVQLEKQLLRKVGRVGEAREVRGHVGGQLGERAFPAPLQRGEIEFEVRLDLCVKVVQPLRLLVQHGLECAPRLAGRRCRRRRNRGEKRLFDGRVGRGDARIGVLGGRRAVDDGEQFTILWALKRGRELIEAALPGREGGVF